MSLGKTLLFLSVPALLAPGAGAAAELSAPGGAVPAYFAREIVASLALNDAHEWTFPHPSGEGHLKISQIVWTDIRKRAGLEDFRLHDLRHTFASYAVMNGVSMPTVSRLLGHGILESTNRYVHLSNDSVRAAAGRVVGHLARATGFEAKGAGK